MAMSFYINFMKMSPNVVKIFEAVAEKRMDEIKKLRDHKISL
jgi:hypothetical protein